MDNIEHFRSLTHVRNILRPALYGQSSKDVEFDIMVNRDGLRVVGYNMATKKRASFEITREDIEGGTYKAAFNPGVQKLKAELDG